MPCTSDGYGDTLITTEENGKLRGMLCEACHALEDKLGVDGAKKVMSKTLRIWWKKHKEADKRRQAEKAERKRLKALAEGAKKKIYSSLTTEEVEALRHEGLLRR